MTITATFLCNSKRVTKKKMYKDIDEKSAKTEDFSQFWLCYIEEIPKTYSDWAPETLAYMKTEEYAKWKERREQLCRENPLGSPISWDLNPMLNLQDYPNPDFIKGHQEFYAYFSPVSKEEQWGDDWDDIPYEHNAEIPYDDIILETRPSTAYEGLNVATKVRAYEVLRLPFWVDNDGLAVRFPKDWGQYGNSPFCVRDINAGAVAWIFAKTGKAKSSSGIAITSDDSPKTFIEKLEKINAEYPYIPEEEGEDD